MLGSTCVLLSIAASLICRISAESIHSREKRFLIVPPTSPTRHQLISGIGIPLNLANEAITLGLVLKAQYFLPTNANELKPIYFPGIFGNFTPVNFVQTQDHPFPNGRRRRREIVVDELSGQKYEKYFGEVKQVGSEQLAGDVDSEYLEETFETDWGDDEETANPSNIPQASEAELADTSGSRWLMYDGLGKLLSSKGLQGRPCVLRGICEAAESKFTHHSGLFGELFHIAFSPSTSTDPIVNADHYDYIKAETLGESGEPCAEIFHECKTSFIDILSFVQESKAFM